MELSNHPGETLEATLEGDGSITLMIAVKDSPDLYQEWTLTSSEADTLGRTLADYAGHYLPPGTDELKSRGVSYSFTNGSGFITYPHSKYGFTK